MKSYQRFLLLMGIVFILNLIWEFSHSFLYINLTGISKFPLLLLASFTDMIIISIIFLIVSLKNKNLDWIKKPVKLDYILIIILGLLIAIFIELAALRIGKWAYTELMPTIFGIGLTPLVQLFITAIISIFSLSFLKICLHER